MVQHRRSPAFTLIEVLIVISLMGILAATIIPNVNPSMREELYAAAEVIEADLAWARTLAVTNNSTYRVTFSTTLHQYDIQHSGSRTALNTLPVTPFTPAASTATKYLVQLTSLTEVSLPIELAGVQTLGSSVQNVTTLEFNSLGATTSTADTKIWIATGNSPERRYLGVRVNHATGLTWVEDFQSTLPTGL
jgi:prepilin-type N-terminal cleavage/methylation domain-containing protein